MVVGSVKKLATRARFNLFGLVEERASHEGLVSREIELVMRVEEEIEG